MSFKSWKRALVLPRVHIQSPLCKNQLCSSLPIFILMLVACSWPWRKCLYRVCALSHVLTLCSPAGCSPPGSTVHGVFQARILEWVAVSYLRGSYWSRQWTWVSCIGKWVLYHWAAWEAHLYHGNQQTPQSGLLNSYQHTAGYAALAPGILLGSWELELALTGIGVDRTTPIWARAPELVCLLSGSFSLAVLRFSCSQIPQTHIADHCFLPHRCNRRFYDCWSILIHLNLGSQRFAVT